MNLARRGLFISSIGALLGGCSAAAMLNATVPRKGFTLERDIAYGPLPRQKLDLYRPDRPRSDGRSVIFFYGGAWDLGSKNDYLFVGQALAARGVTTIIADYRIYPGDVSRLRRGWSARNRVGGRASRSRSALPHGALVRRPYCFDAGRRHALSRNGRRQSHEVAGRHRTGRSL